MSSIPDIPEILGCHFLIFVRFLTFYSWFELFLFRWSVGWKNILDIQRLNF